MNVHNTRDIRRRRRRSYDCRPRNRVWKKRFETRMCVDNHVWVERQGRQRIGIGSDHFWRSCDADIVCMISRRVVAEQEVARDVQVQAAISH
ncbi:hypothetical protein DPMN_053615 [Dreissena polymorpha]|uniref:Uncharacterized protein n=1 Tax=Dreissena polymorpha TaxID=45954 RepID=A0A9D4CNP9_DREPO|nr:hypothetical protein DPMN_053615 [Dreissena polymorpha]